MNVASSTCAPSGRALHWDQIDWDRCRRHVRRLQAGIVKARRVKTVLKPAELTRGFVTA